MFKGWQRAHPVADGIQHGNPGLRARLDLLPTHACSLTHVGHAPEAFVQHCRFAEALQSRRASPAGACCHAHIWPPHGHTSVK
eukprot:365872-Chlamydomonas_euryale.AAC.2